MAELTGSALKVLKTFAQEGFKKPGEALQAHSFNDILSSTGEFRTVKAELVAAGLCEDTERSSLKLTAAGAETVKKLT